MYTPTGKKGWRSPNTSWQDALTQAMGEEHHNINLKAFTCITDVKNEPRLIIEAPSKVVRRELLLALKKNRSHTWALLHLSPEERAKKSLLYSTVKRRPLRIEDWGDIVILSHP